jgi:hypothetical protein
MPLFLLRVISDATHYQMCHTSLIKTLLSQHYQSPGVGNNVVFAFVAAVTVSLYCWYCRNYLLLFKSQHEPDSTGFSHRSWEG